MIETEETPGGDTPLYKLDSYLPPHRVGFLRRFGLKTGVYFAHFGLESSMAFEGIANYGSVWTYLPFPFQMSKKEREICEFENRNEFKEFFLFAL